TIRRRFYREKCGSIYKTVGLSGALCRSTPQGKWRSELLRHDRARARRKPLRWAASALCHSPSARALTQSLSVSERFFAHLIGATCSPVDLRSEERRVGKEWRSRMALQRNAQMCNDYFIDTE